MKILITEWKRVLLALIDVSVAVTPLTGCVVRDDHHDDHHDHDFHDDHPPDHP